MPVVLAVFVALLFLTPPEAAFAQEAGQQVKIAMPADGGFTAPYPPRTLTRGTISARTP